MAAANGYVAVNITTAGDTIVIPAVQGQPISVIALILSLAEESTVQFKSGSTPFSGPQTMLAIGLDPQTSPWYVTANGEPFVIALGTSVGCNGTVWFRLGAS